MSNKNWPISTYLEYLAKRKENGSLSEREYLKLIQVSSEVSSPAEKKRNKYGAESRVVEGVKFDSKMEMVVHDLSKKFRIPFEFQFKLEVAPGFEYLPGDQVRARTATWDFSYKLPFAWLLMDCKGMKQTQEGFRYRVFLTKNKFRRKAQKNRPRLYVVHKGQELTWVTSLQSCIQQKSITPISQFLI